MLTKEVKQCQDLIIKNNSSVKTDFVVSMLFFLLSKKILLMSLLQTIRGIQPSFIGIFENKPSQALKQNVISDLSSISRQQHLDLFG